MADVDFGDDLASASDDDFEPLDFDEDEDEDLGRGTARTYDREIEPPPPPPVEEEEEEEEEEYFDPSAISFGSTAADIQFGSSSDEISYDEAEDEPVASADSFEDEDDYDSFEDEDDYDAFEDDPMMSDPSPMTKTRPRRARAPPLPHHQQRATSSQHQLVDHPSLQRFQRLRLSTAARLRAGRLHELRQRHLRRRRPSCEVRRLPLRHREPRSAGPCNEGPVRRRRPRRQLRAAGAAARHPSGGRQRRAPPRPSAPRTLPDGRASAQLHLALPRGCAVPLQADRAAVHRC